jgi:hypothetical protein
MEADSQLLLFTEIGLASNLVVFFNAVKTSWDNRCYMTSASWPRWSRGEAMAAGLRAGTSASW